MTTMTTSPTHPKVHRILAGLVAVLLIACTFLVPKTEGQNKYPLLDFKMVQARYEKAKADYESKKQSYDYGIISEQELNQAKLELTNSEVEYQKAANFGRDDCSV